MLYAIIIAFEIKYLWSENEWEEDHGEIWLQWKISYDHEVEAHPHIFGFLNFYSKALYFEEEFLIIGSEIESFTLNSKICFDFKLIVSSAMIQNSLNWCWTLPQYKIIKRGRGRGRGGGRERERDLVDCMMGSTWELWKSLILRNPSKKRIILVMLTMYMWIV